MLRISVLGRMLVELDDAELPAPAARRAWSLLAYLALREGPQPRNELAARFWPDVMDASARASLRSAVWALRRALGPAGEGHLVADRDDVGLATGAGLWVDAREFDRLLADGRDAEALELARGELLEGAEDEWVLAARDAHRERILDALERLACAADAAGDHGAAIELTRRQVALDALGEDAHRRLMERLAAVGDRAAALVVYRTLSERLRGELAVAPSPVTRALVDRLRSEAAELGGAGEPDVPDLAPLIGRTEELGRLMAAWGRAAGGRGGTVAICGEAGIGKTRLVGEMRARAARAGARSATCAALDLGGAAPFGLWAELIRELLPGLPPPPAGAIWPDDLARLAPEVHARFARARPERPFCPPDLERARLFEAVVALVEWAAAEQPLVLVVEDAHIADGPSLELTGYVARRIGSLPVLLALTRRRLPRRTEADQLEHALRSRGLLREELTLGPLRSEHVADLARSTARLAASDVRRVVAAAEGNALLTVETARAIARGEREPSSLGGAVRGAFGGLSAHARAFAELAAVAARELDRSEVAALPVEHPVEAVVEALDSGMFTARDGRIGFRHALLREVVYGELAEPQRLALHERWAELLLHTAAGTAPGRAAEVARHLRLAGRDRDAAAQFAVAAEDARAVAALAEAAGYLREALAITPARADLWLELGEVEAWLGRRVESEQAFASACQHLAGAPPLALARAYLRHARWYHGPLCLPVLVGSSSQVALDLIATAGGETAAERREALANLAWVHAIAGTAERTEELLAQLGELLAAAPPDDLAIYQVGHTRSLSALRAGDFEAAYEPSIAAGEAIGRVGRMDLAYGCWANAAGAAAAAGDYELALSFLDRTRTATSSSGMLSIDIHTLAMRSFVLLRLDRRDAARDCADAAAELADRVGDPALIGMAAHDRGMVALADADFMLAARLLEQALAADTRISRPTTRVVRAEALARAGRCREAEEELRAMVLEPVRASDFPQALVPRLARVQGLIAARAGDFALAAKRLAEARDGWRRQVSRAARGASMTAVLVDLGRPIVGLVEPERELEGVLRDLARLQRGEQEVTDAVVS